MTLRATTDEWLPPPQQDEIQLPPCLERRQVERVEATALKVPPAQKKPEAPDANAEENLSSDFTSSLLPCQPLPCTLGERMGPFGLSVPAVLCLVLQLRGTQ